MQNQPMKDRPAPGQPRIDGRMIAIGLLLLVAALVFIPRLLDGGGDDDAATTRDDNDEVLDNTGSQPVSDASDLGRPVAAPSVDRDNCPVETTSEFDETDDIYVVAPDSDVVEGTSVFVRIYQDGTPVEDLPEIIADQDYENSCIAFVVEAVDGEFDPGQYEAEFYVNGNAAGSVTFEIN
jgi:hypothetical protein